MGQTVASQPQSQPLCSATASLLGITAALLLTRLLPLVPSTLLNALVLAGGARLIPLCVQPVRWWGLIGCATGTLVGNGWVLARALKESHPADHLMSRIAVVLLLAAAGALAGHGLARLDRLPEHRRPRDLIRAASSLTAGIFAVLVTLTYVHLGLDGARAFSSRLSTGLTILVVCLVAPGWLSQRLRRAPLPAQRLR